MPMPNEDKKLPFVAKVRTKDGTFKPIYIAPDATDKVQGDVKLSDAINSGSDAATGMTAATPKAVKAVADKSLDKVIETEQVVNGKVTFKKGVAGNVTGNLIGNASTATKLATPRKVSTKSGSLPATEGQLFDGTKDITLPLGRLDATTLEGEVPLRCIPRGALERLITVANAAERLALKNTSVQKGDSVFQADTKVMYYVVDDTKLNLEEGYKEYAAGTALNAKNAEKAKVAEKLGSTNIGSATKPIYLENGTPKEFSSNLGNDFKPVYLKNGAITESVGSTGSSVTPIYMEQGTIKPSTSTVGANNKPTYLKDGTVTQINYTIDKSVPSDAKFTDTTYSVFKPATATAAGSTGLVPQPPQGANLKFLRGDGTWQIAGEVTGVKGEKEATYRKGNVNITPGNIGAIATTGNNTLDGTLNIKSDGNALTITKKSSAEGITFSGNRISSANLLLNEVGGLVKIGVGGLEMNGNIVPKVGNSNISIGTVGNAFSSVHATNFYGQATSALVSNSAKALEKTLTLSGSVTGSVSLAAEGASANLKTTLSDKSVTNGKLADDVGTVYVGTTEPAEPHVKIWVKI